MGKVAVESNDEQSLLKFSTEILEMDPKNSTGWYFKAQYFLAKATLGNMQSEGYVSSMKKAFEYADLGQRNGYAIKIADNLAGYINNLVNQKDSMGLMGGSTLDSVYIDSFAELVKIKSELDPFILIDEFEVKKSLENLMMSYGQLRKKFPFNPLVNGQEIKKLFQNGLDESTVQQLSTAIDSERASSAVGLVVLGILGAILLIWWFGWGILW
jgi:hypothetical protein